MNIAINLLTDKSVQSFHLVWYAKGEKFEEGMSIEEDIPVVATLTDLEICQTVCEQDQVLKVDDSDGDECFEENPPTNAEIRQALHILKRSFQHRSTNFEKRRVRTIKMNC
ncbi:hypothetical protein AVEN_184810-1 [Araneus ventricosus]|uniref:Uncharacterized protein n=1 Tax=Araneus ventricosus TaxID=182803 RepID=A0A4Y2JB34_ARAVE|nr:hypothetical protein AVEN_184810-1 [Araneus ventricosus]